MPRRIVFQRPHPLPQRGGFRFQRRGCYDNGKIRGDFVPSGYVPTFYEELRDYGIDVDLGIFGDMPELDHEGHQGHG